MMAIGIDQKTSTTNLQLLSPIVSPKSLQSKSFFKNEHPANQLPDDFSERIVNFKNKEGTNSNF